MPPLVFTHTAQEQGGRCALQPGVDERHVERVPAVGPEVELHEVRVLVLRRKVCRRNTTVVGFLPELMSNILLNISSNRGSCRPIIKSPDSYGFQFPVFTLGTLHCFGIRGPSTRGTTSAAMWSGALNPDL